MTVHSPFDAPLGAPRERGAEPALLSAAGLQERLPGLVAAFSTALPRQPDETLGLLLRRLAGAQWDRATEHVPPPLLLHQTHSTRVLALDDAAEALSADGLHPSPDADGAWATVGRARLLAVKTADCVPLLALDAEHGRYGVLHAGWRGTAEGILPALLEAWRVAGSNLQRVELELGPHIQGCCYEVQADCLEHFAPDDLRGAVRQGPGHTWLQLAAVLRAQAVRAGVPAAQVRVSTRCTYCCRLPGGAAPYASYRRAVHAGQPFADTNVTLVGVLEAP